MSCNSVTKTATAEKTFCGLQAHGVFGTLLVSPPSVEGNSPNVVHFSFYSIVSTLFFFPSTTCVLQIEFKSLRKIFAEESFVDASEQPLL